VIVDNFNVTGAVIPNKTNSPLIVDADAVLSLSIALQSLKPVAE
jgi:hypothetical protein